MASRKLPFGYQIQQGRIEVHPGELETLQWIFCRYVEGSSYKKIAVLLQERGVSYVLGKPWNKNMVARILADERYIGTDGYPKLIDEKLFRSVGDTLSSRASPIQKSPACTAVQWLAVCGTCGKGSCGTPASMEKNAGSVQNASPLQLRLPMKSWWQKRRIC